MAFRVNMREGTAGTKSGTVIELADAAGACRAEVWPFLGFNCLRWQVRQDQDQLADLLYVAPDWETNPVPTRSGHPILFPFPNRLSQGQLDFRGHKYQLPLTESTGQHAIHGFTPRLPWRVLSTSSQTHYASVVGQFQLSEDFPEALAYWPGDATITVSYTLQARSLTVEAEIENLGPSPLPCGLGYHPYFRIPGRGDQNVDDWLLSMPATHFYEAVNGIPSGRLNLVQGESDFRERKPIGSSELDRLYTGLTLANDAYELATVAELSHPERDGRLPVRVSPSFRELLLFIPPHRQAIAIEPYTCASDAATLQARGADAGWMIIPPESTWVTTVEYSWISDDR